MASIKTLVFLAWMFFGFGTLVYAVLATESNRFIIFKEPIPDKALPDHVIRTEKVANEGSCRVECYLEPNCVSINVGPAEEGGHTCELNNATEESSSQSVLKKKMSYTYYAIENICHVHGDPCPGVNNLCQVGFTDKGYRCKCRDGYEYAGNVCQDIDECYLDKHNCKLSKLGMKCVNEPGSFRCDCLSGFVKDGTICKDTNECESASLHNCPPNSKCVNVPGSFRCDCDPGFTNDGAMCKECQDALGMEKCSISDGQISASSEYDAFHAAIQGRLHFQATKGKAGAWSAGVYNASQWLQIDLGSMHKVVTGVATQGRNGFPQWVTKYKLQYNDYEGNCDGMNTSCKYYREPGEIKDEVFDGNKDSDTVVRHNLSTPIRARYIRFRPVEWYDGLSMRVELYGCQDCQHALGMETRQIPDEQISASSEYHPKQNHAANHGRLHFKTDGNKAGAWAAGANDDNQWLQIDLGSQHTRITGVATQGRNGKCCLHWVTKYKLQYSDYALSQNFQYYKEKGQTGEKVFEGNTDPDTVVRHNLSTPITARYIRFEPEQWQRHITMRVELYGCQANWKKINDNPVCFGARDDSYGVFHISQSGLIYTFKLVYRSGELKCTSSGASSYWGCSHNSMTLATVIAHPDKTVLPLAKYGKSAHGCQYTYKIDGVSVTATELVFNNLPSPMTVSTGQEFQIWFGQDLADCTEANNSGETCADVYAWYA